MTREYSFNERMKWLESLHKTPASATVAIEDPSGQLLIVKATYKSYWTMPGGVIDAGESPKQAALREVKEEVGLSLTPEDTQFVGVVFRTSDAIDTYQFIFRAKIDDTLAGAIVLQESEIAEHAFVSRDQIRSNDRLCAPLVQQWAEDAIAYYGEQAIDLLAE